MPVIQSLVNQLASKVAEDDLRKREVYEFMGELQEAALMGGSGPWLGPMTFSEAAQQGGSAEAHKARIASRESFAGSQGANGLFELELNNWEWRREINFGWLEFSRWGIQQIILLSRLYYIKNPIVRRLVNVCAIYVFGRGVEISSPDPDANDAIKAFLERNQKTLGQVALTDLERRKDYDGNLFFAFFTDRDTGDTDVRTIDATEMQEIVTDSDDADTELLFKRQWFERTFVTASGLFQTVGKSAWYPSLNHWQDVQDGKAVKEASINGQEIIWDTPVYHRKCGTAGKWLFGCPRIYPMLDWAKASRKFLEHCAAVKAALAQIAMTITTKGGQQALEGIKQQLQSTVATGNSSWYEQNPTAVSGSIWASGPGTQLAAFKSSGEGGDPEEVRQYKLMCCMVKDVPETFLADVSTGNLATATSLDRPTELAFMSLQEEWREDLCVIVKFALRNSLKATNGKVREALMARNADLKVVDIREAARVRKSDGTWKYAEAVVKKDKPDALEVMVTFPSIREGDIPQLVTATVAALTLGQMSGTNGIDQKTGIIHLMTLLGIDGAQEIGEEMFPEDQYEPDRTVEDEPTLAPMPPGAMPPMSQSQPGIVPGEKPKTVEAAIDRLTEALRKWTREGWVTINGEHVLVGGGDAAGMKSEVMYRSTKGLSSDLPKLNDQGVLYVTPDKEYSKSFGKDTQALMVTPHKTLDLTHIKADEEVKADDLVDVLKSHGVKISPDLRDRLERGDGSELLQHFGQYGQKPLADAIKKAGFDSVKINEYVADTGKSAVSMLVLDPKIAAVLHN